MKIKLNKTELIIEYEDKEWEEIKTIHEELGLQVAETEMAWGGRYKAKYYRDVEGRFVNHLRKAKNELNCADSINEPVIVDGRLNVAIFRVVPENNIARIPLNQVLSVVEWNEILETMSKVLKIIFDTVIFAEAVIKLKPKIP